MKRRRFISDRNKTTLFHQGKMPKYRNLFLVPVCSSQQGAGGGGGETGEGGWPAAVGLRFRSHLMLERVAGRRTTDGDCESAKRAASLPELVSPEIFDPATASRRLRFAFLLFFCSSSRRLEISISKSHI